MLERNAAKTKEEREKLTAIVANDENKDKFKVITNTVLSQVS